MPEREVKKMENKTSKTQIYTYEFNGFTATVIRPETPNGKWIWKTEFLYAFDQAELRLVEMGYTRVYYAISNMYGSHRATRLMHDFRAHVVEKFKLDEKCTLFGFSRGGLYAFSFALFYPEYVDSVYLDAPVLDIRTWPTDKHQIDEMCREYSISRECIDTYRDNPVNNFSEFFSHGIPLLLVAGDSDEIVPFDKNSGKMIEFCRENGIDITYIVKPGCKHHPHSLENTAPIVEFVQNRGGLLK